MRFLFVLWLLLFTLQTDAHRAVVNRGTHVLDWHTHQISRVVSGGIHDGKEVGSTRHINGKHCMTGRELDIDVLDDFAFDIDEPVELKVTFDLKTGPSTVELWYDKNRPETTNPSFRGATEAVTLPSYSKDTRWHTQTFQLDRARFAGLGRLSTDFYLGSGDKKAMTICDITLKRSYTTAEPEAYGRLFLEVRDTSGKKMPVRVGLYDNTGRMPLPSDEAVPIKWLEDIRRVVELMPVYGGAWPVDNRRTFYIDGSYHTKLPTGTYNIVISHGLEYRFVQKTIQVDADKVSRVDIQLQPWVDMPAKGWYSGDVHLHYGRGHAKDDKNILAHAMAEDLHVTNLLEMGSTVTTMYKQYNWGAEARYGKGSHYLVPGQEDPRTNRLGHTVQLNLTAPVRFPERYYLYHKVFEAVQEQGGVTGYAHVNDPQLPYFNARGGLALDVPFGLVDAVEIMAAAGGAKKSPWVADLWFDFLNLGYPLAPMAGSDYMDGGIPPGAVRNYVYLGDKFSVQAWFDALKAGKSFVTSGPLLTMTVNGQRPGEALNVQKGDSLNIQADAQLSADIGTLERLELYEQGELVESVSSSEGKAQLRLNYQAQARHGTWFVLLAYGKDDSPEATLAATAPVYVSVNGSGFCKVAAVEAITQRMKAAMDTIFDGSYVEKSGWSTLNLLKDVDSTQETLLKARIQQAHALYDKLAAEARQGRCADLGKVRP